MKTLMMVALVLSACSHPAPPAPVPQAQAVVAPVVATVPVTVTLPEDAQILRDIKGPIQRLSFEGNMSFRKVTVAKKAIDEFEKDECRVVVTFRIDGDKGSFNLTYVRRGDFWKLRSMTSSMF